MIKKIITCFAALALVACGPLGGVNSVGTVATVNAAAKDTIRLSFQALDTVALMSTALAQVGVIRIGSPKALGIANGLDTTRNALNAASAAQQAGNSGEYLRAINEANKAFKIVKGLVEDKSP